MFKKILNFNVCCEYWLITVFSCPFFRKLLLPILDIPAREAMPPTTPDSASNLVSWNKKGQSFFLKVGLCSRVFLFSFSFLPFLTSFICPLQKILPNYSSRTPISGSASGESDLRGKEFFSSVLFTPPQELSLTERSGFSNN